MNKAKKLFAIFAMAVSVSAFADQDKDSASVVFDICSVTSFSGMKAENYVIQCLYQGGINIETLFKRGYRVTAATVMKESNGTKTTTTLFVEKANR